MQRKEIAREAAKRYRPLGRCLGFVVFVCIVVVVVYFRHPRLGARIQFDDESRSRAFRVGESEGTPTNDRAHRTDATSRSSPGSRCSSSSASSRSRSPRYAIRRRQGAPQPRRRSSRPSSRTRWTTASTTSARSPTRAGPSSPRTRGSSACSRRTWLSAARAETPDEYLDADTPELEVERRSVRRLTDLFTEAKFSHHDVDAGDEGGGDRRALDGAGRAPCARARRERERRWRPGPASRAGRRA